MPPFVPYAPPGRIVLPARVGSALGPTRSAARGGRWRRTGVGVHVPASVERTVAQRIAERALPLPPGAAVTGWAALRLHGAAYFEDSEHQPRIVPVRIPADRHPRDRSGVRWLRRRARLPIASVQGVACVPPSLALMDEIGVLGQRDAVVAVDMTIAAGLVHVEELMALAGDDRTLGVLRLLSSHSASPPESKVRLAWLLDAGLPVP